MAAVLEASSGEEDSCSSLSSDDEHDTAPATTAAPRAADTAAAPQPALSRAELRARARTHVQAQPNLDNLQALLGGQVAAQPSSDSDSSLSDTTEPSHPAPSPAPAARRTAAPARVAPRHVAQRGPGRPPQPAARGGTSSSGSSSSSSSDSDSSVGSPDPTASARPLFRPVFRSKAQRTTEDLATLEARKAEAAAQAKADAAAARAAESKRMVAELAAEEQASAEAAAARAGSEDEADWPDDTDAPEHQEAERAAWKLRELHRLASAQLQEYAHELEAAAARAEVQGQQQAAAAAGVSLAEWQRRQAGAPTGGTGRGVHARGPGRPGAAAAAGRLSGAKAVQAARDRILAACAK